MLSVVIVNVIMLSVHMLNVIMLSVLAPFIPGRTLQPSLMFPPALALPTNIRLGWKRLPGTNTLAYYENP